MMMREQLLTIADAYAAATGLGRKRISTIVMNGGAKLDNIAEGGDLVTRSWERAMQWFSDNWPENAPWPADVERPERRRNPSPAAGSERLEAAE